jgi:hypothetical protein
MPLIQDQRTLIKLKDNKNLDAIHIKTTTENFNKRFDGSISQFFKCLKNGLNSFNGVSNREYFKGISGAYFSLADSEEFEIIIIYDTSIKKLNPLQVSTRLKKLLGMNIEVSYGTYDDYATRIFYMLGITRKSQTFGEYYSKKPIFLHST